MLNIIRYLGGSSLLVACLGLAGCMVNIDETASDEGEEVIEVAEPIVYNGHDYLFNLVPANWNQARANCLFNGYNLASINDSAEENWLQQQENARGGGVWWIGYSDSGFEGIWVWEDQQNTTYTNWNIGEPNNGGGSAGPEHCALDNTTGGRWNDGGCTAIAKYICERSL